MKKIFAVLTVLLVFFCLSACALAEYEAVIAHPNVAERVELRSEPDAFAPSLGRFYTGTPLTVHDVDADGWASVTIGSLKGYVESEYLMRMNRNYGAPCLFHTAEPLQGRLTLRAEESNPSDAVAATAGKVYVLGEIGEDWRYVQIMEQNQFGFVRTGQLKNHQILIERAYMKPAQGDGAAVYEDREMQKQVGWFYAGAAVRVTGFSRVGGWAQAESLAGNEELPDGWGLRGYVKLSDLEVFIQPWQVENRTLNGIALQEISLPAPVEHTIPRGAAMALIGETEDAYQIVYGDATETEYYGALVDASLVEAGNTYAAYKGAGGIGYAYIPPEVDEEGYTLGTKILPISGNEPGAIIYNAPLTELLAENDDFLQVRQHFNGAGFFVPRQEGERILLYEDVYRAQDLEKGPGEWTAAEEESGLWYLRTEPGKASELTLKNDGEFKQNETYSVPADEKEASYYTVYIAPGTKVTLSGGGTLRALDADAPVIVPQEGAEDFPEDQILFSGSGRFFCDAQIADWFDYFEYTIEPLPGAENPYVRYGNLFTDDQAECEILPVPHPYWEAYAVSPGEFLELHECILRINYGNG